MGCTWIVILLRILKRRLSEKSKRRPVYASPRSLRTVNLAASVAIVDQGNHVSSASGMCECIAQRSNVLQIPKTEL